MEKKEKKRQPNHAPSERREHDSTVDAAGKKEGLKTASVEQSVEEEKGIEGLREKLEEKEKEAKEYYDRMLRVAADLENYKKRAAREKEDYTKFANEDLIKEVLPFIDNLERAINHSEKTQDLQSLVDGVKLTVQGLLQKLSRFGVSPIESVGKPFDPAMHEAMLVVESDQHEPHHVVQEFQRGYFLNDRLLRPATVSVSKPSDKEVEAAE